MVTRLRYRPVVLWLLLLCVLGAAPSAHAQPVPARVLSDEARVSVLTIYPGPALHARFGHTAIRVADPLRDIDFVYNYGTFEFDSPLFVATFIRGQLDYYLSVAPMEAALHHYQHVERRAVVEQVLDLTADQREQVFAFLRDNARPENRTYRYRFLDDNCSTRVRDVFESVLGPSLRFDGAEVSGMTYREMLAVYMDDTPWLWLGMDLAIGREADRPVTVREAMFLPLSLMAVFDEATMTVDGESRQLVREKQPLHWYEGADEQASAMPWPAVLMWAMLGLIVAMTWREARRPKVTAVQRRRGAVLADALLLGTVGVAGLVLAGLWGATEHDLAGPNWNLAWAWPTHAVAAVALLRWPTGGPWLRRYLLLTAAGGVVAVLTLAWWPQAVPWPAVVPVVLAVALRAGWLGWAMRGDAGSGVTVAQPSPTRARQAGGR